MRKPDGTGKRERTRRLRCSPLPPSAASVASGEINGRIKVFLLLWMGNSSDDHLLLANAMGKINNNILNKKLENTPFSFLYLATL
jgi:hypothetical protein